MARVEIPLVILTDAGAPATAAAVAITYRSNGSPAPWWTSETGGVSSTASIATDSRGRISAWVERGAYNLAITGTGIAAGYTETYDATPAGDKTVDTLWLGDSTVDSNKLVDLGIGQSDLASNAVTTAKIVDANVTKAKLSTDALQAFLQLAANADRKVAFNTANVTIADPTNNPAGTEITVTHGLGITPFMIIATVAGTGAYPPVTAVTNTWTSTTFKLNVRAATASASIPTTQTVSWLAIG